MEVWLIVSGDLIAEKMVGMYRNVFFFNQEVGPFNKFCAFRFCSGTSLFILFHFPQILWEYFK